MNKNVKLFLRWFGLGSGVLAIAVIPILGLTQAEHLKTVSAASTKVGRGAPIQERTVALNMVNVTTRHCQKYSRQTQTKNGDQYVWTYEIDANACAQDSSTIFYSHTDHNLRTNAGSDAQSSQMGNTSTQAASCNYIALTNDATAPSATDTTLTSEISTNGLGRAQGTYAHTTGTASFTVQKVFSATGTQASQKTGLFNASSSGTLCFENTYTQVTVNNGDTLTVTWTINI